MELSLDELSREEMASIYHHYSSADTSQDSDVDTDDEFYKSMKPDPVPYSDLMKKMVIIEPTLHDLKNVEPTLSGKKKRTRKKKKKKQNVTSDLHTSLFHFAPKKKEKTKTCPTAPITTTVNKQSRPFDLYYPLVSSPTVGATSFPSYAQVTKQSALQLKSSKMDSFEQSILGKNNVSPELDVDAKNWLPKKWRKFLTNTPLASGKLFHNFMNKYKFSEFEMNQSLTKEFVSLEMQKLRKFVENPSERQKEFAQKIKLALINNQNVLWDSKFLLDYLQDVNGKFVRLDMKVGPKIEFKIQQDVSFNTNSGNDNNLNKNKTSLLKGLYEVGGKKENNVVVQLQNSKNIGNSSKTEFLASCKNANKIRSDSEYLAILKDLNSYYYDYPGKNLQHFLNFREQYLCGSLPNRLEINSEDDYSETAIFEDVCTSEGRSFVKNEDHFSKVSFLASCKDAKKINDDVQCLAILEDCDSFYYNYPGRNLQHFLNFREQYLCGSLYISPNSFKSSLAQVYCKKATGCERTNTSKGTILAKTEKDSQKNTDYFHCAISEGCGSHYDYPGENFQHFLNFREQYLCGSLPNTLQINSEEYYSETSIFEDVCTSEDTSFVKNEDHFSKVSFLASCKDAKKINNDVQCLAILEDCNSFYYNYPGRNLQHFLNFREQYLCGSLSISPNSFQSSLAQVYCKKATGCERTHTSEDTILAKTKKDSQKITEQYLSGSLDGIETKSTTKNVSNENVKCDSRTLVYVKGANINSEVKKIVMNESKLLNYIRLRTIVI